MCNYDYAHVCVCMVMWVGAWKCTFQHRSKKCRLFLFFTFFQEKVALQKYVCRPLSVCVYKYRIRHVFYLNIKYCKSIYSAKYSSSFEYLSLQPTSYITLIICTYMAVCVYVCVRESVFSQSSFSLYTSEEFFDSFFL